jgi:hypothetical protein
VTTNLFSLPELYVCVVNSECEKHLRNLKAQGVLLDLLMST